MNVVRAILSLVFPGLGQLMLGELWLALGFLLFAIVMPGIGHVCSALHALLSDG